MRIFSGSGGPSHRRDVAGQRTAATPPEHFAAVAEAIQASSDSLSACEVAGRTLAVRGVDLGTALEQLRETTLRAARVDPTFDQIRALSLAWSEETLAYLHRAGCEDPLTGVSSLAHVRARLGEIYRGEESQNRNASRSHALVVIELIEGADLPVLEQGLVFAAIAQITRTVFQGSQTVGRAGVRRLVVVVRRHDKLGRQVSLLDQMLRDSVAQPCRVWIEGLPTAADAAPAVLDELARD